MGTVTKAIKKILHLVKEGYTGHMIDHGHRLIHHVENGYSCHLAEQVPHDHQEFVHEIRHHLELGYKKCEHCFPNKDH